MLTGTRKTAYNKGVSESLVEGRHPFGVLAPINPKLDPHFGADRWLATEKPEMFAVEGETRGNRKLADNRKTSALEKACCAEAFRFSLFLFKE